jgi:hypothetical protein
VQFERTSFKCSELRIERRRFTFVPELSESCLNKMYVVYFEVRTN